MLEINRIYNEDCLAGMKRLAGQSVDAIITDLPYGVLNKSNPASRWDRRIPFDVLWKEYMRVKKPNTPIILFGQGMFTSEAMASCPKLWKYNLIWVKDRVTGHLNANRMPLRRHEDIMVFYERQPVYHPQMQPCRPSERNHGRKTKCIATNRCYGNVKATEQRIADDKFPTSVISIPKEHKTGVFLHPTQKPVALLEYLIKSYTDEGALVLDSCIGSGTTAVAALRNGRNFIGFEIDKEYYEIAKARIESETSI